MRSHNLFLLVYLLGICFGLIRTQWIRTKSRSLTENYNNANCSSNELCSPVSGSASSFLQCVGLPSSDTGTDHMRRLREMLQGMMDLYTFMKSSMTGLPVLSLQQELQLNPGADPLQNEALVQMWMEVRITPLLRSITKKFLSCLSTKNFSCSTYQIMVRELSQHYSEMNPVRRQWIYTFFMYPFLSGDRVAGCVEKDESNAQWLMKNFGAFRVRARLNDLSTLNMFFSGLEVLGLLSPAQKAELLMRPEVASLDNGTLTLVFNNLLTGGSAPPPHTASPGFSPAQANQSSSITPVDGIMMVVRPITSFVHEFASFLHESEVENIRITHLANFLIKFTLSELARPQRPEVPPGDMRPTFDFTNPEDWFRQVVVPLLRRFLPDDMPDLMHENITLAFHQVFYLDHGMGPGNDSETSEIQDVCSVTLDKAPCGLTDVVVNVANILHCAAWSNLTITEATVTGLIVELAGRLNSLIRELSKANFTELGSEVLHIFGVGESESLTEHHLNDPDFIRLWFKVKLMPLLPDVPVDLLSCLSTNNFSCAVFQTIVAELSKHSGLMHSDPMNGENIYRHFIFPFLLHHTSEPQCVSSASNSTEWMIRNFGFFARFAPLSDFYRLNSNFSGLENLHLLTPRQTAELLLLPPAGPPPKDVVVERVFDFLLESGDDRFFVNVLHEVVLLASELNPPCRLLQSIFYRLYAAIPLISPEVEPAVWAGIDDLINVTPEECLLLNITCPVIQSNGTLICKDIDSSDLDSYLNMHKNVSCNFPLETYACAKLENFTADQLVSLLKCNLPGNSSDSRVLWKSLLNKLSAILDPALDLLADMPKFTVIPSAREVLDVIGDLRVSLLTDEQLMNGSVVSEWFSGRLSGLLPAASGKFLRCLSRRNLSCQSYQKILQVFIHHFDNMTSTQQLVVLEDFILGFLSHSGPACVALSNGSEVWLTQNLGPFSRLQTLEELRRLNPAFNPLEALRFLTPEQIAELVVLDLPGLPEKDVIVNMVFEHLTESPDEERFADFLRSFLMLFRLGNLSCPEYRTLFTRLDLAVDSASPHLTSLIIHTMLVLSVDVPPGCIINSGQCNVTRINETAICSGVNSTRLQHQLDGQQLDGHFCDFPVEEFACASLWPLNASGLAEVLACSCSSDACSSRPVWKLFLFKASLVLDAALDILSDGTPDPRNPALTIILDVIREIRLDVLGRTYSDPRLIHEWFGLRLRPLLPAVSADFLSCLATKESNCSTYQRFVQILSDAQPRMELSTQTSVVTHFIQAFLGRNNTADPSCSSNISNSAEWLQKNLGRFSVLLSFRELLMLYPDFKAMEALSELTVRQLAEVSATPGQLTSAGQVNDLMQHVHDQQLAAFFDQFSADIMGHQNMFPPVVISAMFQVVLDRANLSDQSVSDATVQTWLNTRLLPLLFNMSDRHVAPFFGILAGRDCGVQQLGVAQLNSTISSLSDVTQKGIHNHIVQSLGESIPLHCFNNSHSFYTFLVNTFMGFQVPKLTSFLSIIPSNRLQQVLASIPLTDLGMFLRRPDVVDNETALCVLYKNYVGTLEFLETEILPEDVRRPTLPCVWPMALRSPNKSEASAWFDSRLRNYTRFLTKSLIGRTSVHIATCQAFQKFVSVLGVFNYTSADFTRRDVYDTIAEYLASAETPRCYEPNDAELNSTAWFAEYIGPFMLFLTLEDLQSFGSAEQIQVFTVNPLNIALLNHTVLPLNLTNFYTMLIYQQDINFNPLLLPLLCLCVVPGQAFTQLTAEESMIILPNLNTLCPELGQQISAALANNFGDSIDASVIAALGMLSSGISAGQLAGINPEDLYDALGTLSNVTNWDQGQANAIARSLLSAGLIEFNSSSSLLMLGSLIVGVPASAFNNINGSHLIAASADPSFRANLQNAQPLIREIFVSKIIEVSSSSDNILANVPDGFVRYIPPVQLLDFSNNSVVAINQGKWNPLQAVLLLPFMAQENAIALLGGPNNLSSSVLQGFTCTGVRNIPSQQIKNLIKASRRNGGDKVILQETQLTCMYNHIKDDPESFQLFPQDVLLFFDYSRVPQDRYREYFVELGSADFSVFSPTLSYIGGELFANAKSFLAITSTSLTEDDILVLGNMICNQDGTYIENSDPLILETLKNCRYITDDQAAAVFAQLQSGRTQYGDPSTWNEATLKGLGTLTLYMNSAFYSYFPTPTKITFFEVLKNNVVNITTVSRLFEVIVESIPVRSKRSAVLSVECIVGNISLVTIKTEGFPFDYTAQQFSACLDTSVLKNSLSTLTELPLPPSFYRVILLKLRECYPVGSAIPDEQVQLLGFASRHASDVDIDKWNITEIDTLSALFRETDGPWNLTLAKAIITKYLSVQGNDLGKDELNAIQETYLCTLDTDVVKTISPDAIREVNILNIISCSSANKRALFESAQLAFERSARATTVPANTYLLMESYLPGANLQYIRTLSSSNINMGLPTFITLDELPNLTVDEVRGLLGTNLPTLLSYQNNAGVRTWIETQLQSDLDTLVPGLGGGRADPTTPAPSTDSPISPVTTGATGSTGTTGTSGGQGVHVHAEAGFIILALLITSHLFLT